MMGIWYMVEGPVIYVAVLVLPGTQDVTCASAGSLFRRRGAAPAVGS